MFATTIQRVQTGVRIEKRLLKVLKALAEQLDMSLGDLLEGMALHQDIEDISALFEPKWRCILYGWWRPEVLRKPEGDSLQSLVQRVVPDSEHHHPIDIFLLVHRHIRKEFEIYYSVYWGDYEQWSPALCQTT